MKIILQRSKVIYLFSVLAFLSMMFPSASMGLEYKGVDFPDEKVIHGKACQLIGVGTFKGLKIIPAEYIAIYLHEPTRDITKVIMSEQIKQFKGHIVFKIKKKLVKNWYKREFSKVIDYEANPDLKEKVDLFLSFFTEDLNKNEEFRVTYIPGKGTEVAIKGDLKAIIPGRDFMISIYTVWFGENSNKACKNFAKNIFKKNKREN